MGPKRPSDGHKKQRHCDSDKKRRHTLKTQVVVDQRIRKIICTAHGRGREHDFKLFKRSGLYFAPETEALGDRGYQGLQKLHANSLTPRKKPPRRELAAANRQANPALAQERIRAQHMRAA